MSTVSSSNLGFPRMGANRALKKLVESFWAQKATEAELNTGAEALRAEHWKLQKDAGLDIIPSNDFSLYDHVLDHSVTLGVVPERYKGLQGLDLYFAMARGLQRPATAEREKVDVPACEMKKWWDTNYHYIVPEFTDNQTFTLATTPKPVTEFLAAKQLGIVTRPVILGPISYLLLGKLSTATGTEPIRSSHVADLLDPLLHTYEKLIQQLQAAGAEWVQVDEPFLISDFVEDRDTIKAAYITAFRRLHRAAPALKLIVATYFERIAENLDIVSHLEIQALHVDLVRAPQQLDDVIKALKPTEIVLSVGVVDGRNVWKTDISKAVAVVRKVVEELGAKRVIVAPSSSLLHSPHSLDAETKLEAEVKQCLSFAAEKCRELVVIAHAVSYGDEAVQKELQANQTAINNRRTLARIHNSQVKEAVQQITPTMFARASPHHLRRPQQDTLLKLPLFPTTTIGSFPQTDEVRKARFNWKKGAISDAEYDQFVRKEIEKCIRAQEELELDVLVHGEFERNDMVEHFGELLDGFVFTENGWVQSYGSRCVKPPIIIGDVKRTKPMTVDVSSYAQSLTNRAVKGMLTGPVTILQWSFVRDDQPRRDTAFQIALAVREEVLDLEKAGIKVIQIDEPAIREGLPLKKADHEGYLKWAVDAFLLATTPVKDSTQIHTHMCYSDFQDIIDAIIRMDADVTSIESSRADLKLLAVFHQQHRAYPNQIGPGLFDIHSPRIPSVEEMTERLQKITKYLPPSLVWVNPDCGLKTRKWDEVTQQLKNLVQVAKEARKATVAP